MAREIGDVARDLELSDSRLCMTKLRLIYLTRRSQPVLRPTATAHGNGS